MKWCSYSRRNSDGKHHSAVPDGTHPADFTLTRQFLPGYFHAPLAGLVVFLNEVLDLSQHDEQVSRSEFSNRCGVAG